MRKWILKAFNPVVRNLGGLSPSRQGTLTANQKTRIEEVCQPGDVILTRSKWEFTNCVIPGFYSHAALVFDHNGVIEAVGKGVRKTSWHYFLHSKDFIGVFRYRFPGNPDAVAERANIFIGKKYDNYFEIGNDSFYCSEMAWQAYADVHKNFKFIKREIFGVKTVLPDDFTCVRYWDNIISCIGKGPV
jgi:uncharacterized protein YycO